MLCNEYNGNDNDGNDNDGNGNDKNNVRVSVSMSFCPRVCQSVRNKHVRAMNNVRVSVSLLFKSVCLSVS